MIDLQLLSKISVDDSQFRKSIVQKIKAKADLFFRKFNKSVKDENWNSCFYQMHDFYRQVTPYCQVSFLNEFQKGLKVLSYSESEIEKREICLTLLDKLKEGLQKNRELSNKSVLG